MSSNYSFSFSCFVKEHFPLSKGMSTITALDYLNLSLFFTERYRLDRREVRKNDLILSKHHIRHNQTLLYQKLVNYLLHKFRR
jgi:hypothetical protein